MDNSISLPIVGAHFRPPAKALLASIPGGCPLFLRPEPTNPYDENAVQVLLRTSDIPSECWENLIIQALGQGFDEDSLRDSDWWHLGYIPKAAKGDAAQELRNVENQQAITRYYAQQNWDVDGEPKLAGSLSFDTAGKPTIVVSPWPIGGAPTG